MPKPLPRLKKRAEFLAAAASGRKRGTHTLMLQVRAHSETERTHLPPMRVGVTATKKLGTAVTRNRVKRRLRALADACLPAYALSGHDYVLIGRHVTADCPVETLRRDLLYALRKLDVTRKE